VTKKFGSGGQQLTREQAARIRSRKNDLDRHCRLLATELTEIERQLLHKQIAKKQLELDQLIAEADPHTAYAFIVSQLRRVGT
jgi:hypothetical protein